MIIHERGREFPEVGRKSQLDNNVTDMAGKARLHDFFSAMDLDHIEGKKKVPTPPAPSQP